MTEIDLNCDMGESFGPWRMGADAELLQYVSSANIACGFHAGDPTVIKRTIGLALENGVAVGAHPSFPDLQGFGRREMRVSAEEVFDMMIYQIAALKGICEALGGTLGHVKPHGALYNQAAKERPLAEAIAKAVRFIDPELIVYGLSQSHLIFEAEKLGLKTASEVFADRTYRSDGTLTPRSYPNALICDTQTAVQQVLQMVKDQAVTSVTGELVSITAETICIHGDGAKALEFAQAVNHALTENGISIAAVT